MVLTDIRRYLRERGQASPRDLAIRFESEESAMLSILEMLAERGEVVALGCGGCASSGNCPSASAPVFVDTTRPVLPTSACQRPG